MGQHSHISADFDEVVLFSLCFLYVYDISVLLWPIP